MSVQIDFNSTVFKYIPIVHNRPRADYRDKKWSGWAADLLEIVVLHNPKWVLLKSC